MVNAYSEALGQEDWALAEGDAAGSGVKGVTAAVLRWRRGLEKVELQRKQDSRESFPGMTYSSMDQQHCTIFCALEGARSSYEPANFMDSFFLVEAVR